MASLSRTPPPLLLWLLHWPLGEHAPVADVWSEMARFKDAFGSDPRLPVRMIGVSNFSVAKLEALPAPKPIVNQVEMAVEIGPTDEGQQLGRCTIQ